MMKVLSPIWVVLLVLSVALPASSDPGQKEKQPDPAVHLPFQPGEKLVYEVSWSKLIQAGTAVMEVSEEKTADGIVAYRLISTASSGRLLSKFYVVSDKIESVFDITNRRPLSYNLDQSHGKRKKKREMTFNYNEYVVTVTADGQQTAYTVPADIQDALSSVYYVRMSQDFIVGKPIIVNVHEDDKNWAVEIQVLGREKLHTIFGDVDTIKLKTYPRYEGVFQNKGEIYIWLTDDARKIPVLMKSTISIGSIVSTLVEAHPGQEKK
jgi:hypothetical protein